MFIQIVNKKRFAVACGVILSIGVVAGGIFFSQYRSYVTDDRLIASFPRDTVLYMRVQDPTAFDDVIAAHDWIDRFGLTPIWDELRAGPWSLGVLATPMPDGSTAELVLALERNSTQAPETITTLRNHGYWIAHRTQPLQRRTVITATRSVEVSDRLRAILALEESSLADDIAVVFGLRPYAYFPAIISVAARDLPLHPMGEVIAQRMSEFVGKRRVVAGIRAIDSHLALTTDFTRAEGSFPITFLDDYTLIVGGKTPTHQEYIESDVIGGDFERTAKISLASVFEARYGVGVKELLDLMEYPLLRVVNARQWVLEWSIPENFSISHLRDSIGLIGSRILSVQYPMRKPLALRDGAFGYELSRNTEITFTDEAVGDSVMIRWVDGEKTIPIQAAIQANQRRVRVWAGDEPDNLMIACGEYWKLNSEVLVSTYEAKVSKKLVFIGNGEGKTSQMYLCIE